MRPSPFFKDVVLTTGTSVVGAVGLVVTTRLLAAGLGPENFGVYSIAKRVFSTAAALLGLGMGVAVARYSALAGEAARVNVLLAGLVVGVIPSVLVASAAATFSPVLSRLVFHRPDLAPVVLSTLVMLVGYCIYVVLYAYYRGSGQMHKANTWQLAVGTAVPVSVALGMARTRTVAEILLFMGIPFFASLVAVGCHLRVGRAELRSNMGEVRKWVRELWEYGLPRVPGGVALAGMFAVGPLLAPYVGSVSEAGFLVASQAVFPLVEVIGAGFGVVMLPRVAQLFAAGQLGFLRASMSDIVTMCVHVGVFIAAQMWVWSDQVILRWLGPDYAPATALLKVQLLGIVPYLVYVMCRSAVDAVDRRAVNTRNLYVALGSGTTAAGLLAAMGLGSAGLAAGTVAGIWVLCGGTLRYLRKARLMSEVRFRLKECAALNAGGVMIGLAAKRVILGMADGKPVALLALVLEPGLFVVYLLGLRACRVRWTGEVERRVLDVQTRGRTGRR